MRLSAPTALLYTTVITSAEAALYDKVINTNYGDVIGYRAFNSTPAGLNSTKWQDITVWKGIPFAATTGGENRWKAPQPAPAWNSTLYASAFGPVCPAETNGNQYPVDENCLTINIWSAANSSDAKLPVVMWSYPALGAARDALFDGGGMAAKDIVFVNYNYRTGSFGWMSHPELSEEFEAVTGHNSSGNWGMLDQFAALKWIRANIQNFGGDPDRVTVMGQSAGSAATQHILNSPLTKGDIVGAIIESGVREPRDPLCATVAENYLTLSDNLAQGVSFLSSLNVSTIAQARALPYSSLVTAFMSSQWSWSATLDGYAMPATYYDTLLHGAANQVPVMTGNTKDESGATYGLVLNETTYIADVEDTYNGTWVQRFLEQYPVPSNGSAGGAYNSQWSDRSKIGTYFWSKLWQTASVQPVYNYFWTHAPPNQTRGAYHESEINYVLNNLYATTDTPWTSEDYSIAATMNSYWANFIKTQNPNGAGLVNWPSVSTSNSSTNSTPMVQYVGNDFKNGRVVDDAKVQLYAEWFNSGLKTY